MFQHTAARRRLGQSGNGDHFTKLVSTHSRPKAAGLASALSAIRWASFNTQPPEGGWGFRYGDLYSLIEFQHTAARRRLGSRWQTRSGSRQVSTHSRPKAAGACTLSPKCGCVVFQHTAARRRLAVSDVGIAASAFVSTHSRPKAAGSPLPLWRLSATIVSTHSRPKAAGCANALARQNRVVSTHSRPKAAGCPRQTRRLFHHGFNTQPPEGGWVSRQSSGFWYCRFQHTAARRRLGAGFAAARQSCNRFNTQPPEGGWEPLSKALLHQVSQPRFR